MPIVKCSKKAMHSCASTLFSILSINEKVGDVFFNVVKRYFTAVLGKRVQVLVHCTKDFRVGRMKNVKFECLGLTGA